MNEKFRQYYNVLNDKSLIDTKTPTEQDENLFDQLIEMKREQYKKSFIGMTISLLIIIFIGIAMKNIVGILLILLFVYLEYGVMKDFFGSKNWSIEYCDYGTVADKFIKEDKNNNDKDYYMIVNANGNELKYKLKKQEFSNFEISDEVIVFAIKEKKETFVAKSNGTI